MPLNTKEKIKKLLAQFGIQAFLLSDERDMRYFSGFAAKDGMLLCQEDGMTLITDGRYQTVAKALSGVELYIIKPGESYLDAAIILLNSSGAKKTGFQDRSLTAAEYLQLAKNCKATLVPLSDALVRMRGVKDGEEIQKIRNAQKITEAAFQDLLPRIKAGMTEKQVAFTLYCLLMEHGADGLAFETIAASGANGALPHAVPTDKPLGVCELLTLDFGAVLQGYHSDMTRTVAIGQPDGKLIEIYDTVLQAQCTAASALKSGMTGREADGIARGIIAKAGYGEYFVHSLGHGVGLEIHELPTLSLRSETVLEPGMVVTVEPGIYVPDVGGVRIEDMCLITDTGCENLTGTDKKLIIL